MAHIVRVDKRSTHAWQVRGPGKRGYHSRLFSDGVYGGREESLAAARAYLEELQASLGPAGQRAPYPHHFHAGRRLKNNKSGINGVTKTHQYHSKSGEKEEYWAAYISFGLSGRPYVKKFLRQRGKREFTEN